MMISPMTFYEYELKGKSPKQIMTVIRSLKRRISKLKNTIEHPDYKVTMYPTEETQLLCSRDYLEVAKEALVKAGGTYTPTEAEKKDIAFNANIPYISKIEFEIGDYFGSFNTYTYKLNEDKATLYMYHSMIPRPSNLDECEPPFIDKEDLFEGLRDLHIGEWHKYYDPNRFGYMVCDGTQWHLYIYYSNGIKPVKIEGSNAYPYNFNKLMEVLEIESWEDEEEADDEGQD